MPTSNWTDVYSENELRAFFPNGTMSERYYVTTSTMREGREYVIARNLMVTSLDDGVPAFGVSGIYRVKYGDSAQYLHTHPEHGQELCIYRTPEDFAEHDLLGPNDGLGNTELICYAKELVTRRTWDLWVAYQQRVAGDPAQALLDKIRYLHRKQEFYQFNKHILPSW